MSNVKKNKYAVFLWLSLLSMAATAVMLLVGYRTETGPAVMMIFASLAVYVREETKTHRLF